MFCGYILRSSSSRSGNDKQNRKDIKISTSCMPTLSTSALHPMGQEMKRSFELAMTPVQAPCYELRGNTEELQR